MPLPAANQASLAAPVDPKLANQLNRFHLRLRLLQHPALLLCTRPDCTHCLPLNPTLAKVIVHLKSHHHPLTKTGKEILAETLAALNLDDPSMVNINPNLLLVNIIKELDILHKGYRCSMCEYAVMSKTSAHKHKHTQHGGKATLDPHVSIQPIHVNGPYTHYLHIFNNKLEPTPPPITFNLNIGTGRDGALKQRVAAFFTRDAELMAKAELDMEGIQPHVVTGNLSPWLKHTGLASILGWQAHCCYWFTWLQSPQPYSLDKSTVKKRADCWAFLITMLIFVTMDGQCLGYYSNDDQEAHLGVSDDFLKVITHLQGIYKHAIDPEVNCDAFTCAHFDKEAEVGLSAASYLLIIQELVEYGQLEHLALLVKDINKAVVTNLKCYLHNNSHSSSGHLQSLRTYKDNLHSWQPGYNFITASDLDIGIFCIHQAARGDAPPHQPLLDPYGAELEFDRDAANSYFALHNEFSKLLAVLIKLTSGLPARGTELVHLQHTNTLVSQCNLFLADSHFVTVLVSNKGKGPPKLIPRFLLHAVGQLVLFYVMEVVPFLHLLYNAVEKPREPSWGLPSRYQDAVQPFNTLVHSKLASCDDSVPLAIKRKLDSLEEDMCHIRRKLDEQTPLAPAANSAISSHITNPSSRSAVLAPPISQALFKVTSSYRTKTLEQAYALNAIYSKESPLIIVMATGSGKSVLFMALLFWTAVLDKSSCKDWL
ncbi:hypothetical protein NDA16_003232 [Ustilago loliicola]|nr:hypothetical protein NDA16_003232 [Ustilago loliicola]